ncbi:alpha/beta hydrolase [Bacteroidia bacterium]|nr:alpha/beta hydrolase [Bacteroidia bacterium]MDC1395922.1 alpha/beta hydrolase [Bacteroidia bacterium]
MNNTHYYILSGLGADERVFARVHLPQNHTHISWIENKSKETIQDYASRIARSINHPNPTLIGLSFGGIVAQEIAAIRPIKELILISTIKSKIEKPWYMGLAGITHIPSILPDYLLAKPNMVTKYAFSIQKPEEVKLLNTCFENMSIAHMKWAMDQIANWQGVVSKTPIFHIHSDHDRLFSDHTRADSRIPGGHFAVFTNASELNTVLEKKFKES